MPNYPPYNLNGKYPGDTYTKLVQVVTESGSLSDGAGNQLSSSINITASCALTSSYTMMYPDIYNSASYVGISQPFPAYPLDVNGNIGVGTGLTYPVLISTQDPTFGNPLINFSNGDGMVGVDETGEILAESLGPCAIFGSYNNIPVVIMQNYGVVIYVGSADKVGIGNNTNPQYLLDIGGDFGNSIQGTFYLSANDNPSYINASGGNVGIGQKSPEYTLDVSGDINTSGIYRQNGNPYTSSASIINVELFSNTTATINGQFYSFPDSTTCCLNEIGAMFPFQTGSNTVNGIYVTLQGGVDYQFSSQIILNNNFRFEGAGYGSSGFSYVGPTGSFSSSINAVIGGSGSANLILLQSGSNSVNYYNYNYVFDGVYFRSSVTFPCILVGGYATDATFTNCAWLGAEYFSGTLPTTGNDTYYMGPVEPADIANIPSVIGLSIEVWQQQTIKDCIFSALACGFDCVGNSYTALQNNIFLVMGNSAAGFGTAYPTTHRYSLGFGVYISSNIYSGVIMDCNTYRCNLPYWIDGGDIRIIGCVPQYDNYGIAVSDLNETGRGPAINIIAGWDIRGISGIYLDGGGNYTIDSENMNPISYYNSHTTVYIRSNGGGNENWYYGNTQVFGWDTNGHLTALAITASLHGTASYALTASYIAPSGLPYRAGQQSVGSLSTSQIVAFSSALSTSSYAVSIGSDSTLASAVSFAATGKTNGGFTCSLSAGISGGIIIDYIAMLNN